MPHAALFVVQQYSSILRLIEVARFNAARGFVGGAAIYNAYIHHEFESVSMPHAALWVVQRNRGARFGRSGHVSMPHAALWVVQLRRSQPLSP